MPELHNFPRRLERAEVLLEKSRISDENKAAIKRFVDFKTAQKVKLPRIVKYITTLRIIAERYVADCNFRELNRDDVVSIAAEIERTDLSEWTKHDYLLILKTFLTSIGHGDLVSWIVAGNPGNHKLPEDLITEDEVMAMIEAASNVRDKAFVACLYEGGFRIGELGTIVIKDVRFDKYGAVVIVTGKTGMRRVRLVFSAPYLARWLELHPLRADRTAPVWITTECGAITTQMTYAAFRQQLVRIAMRASVQHKVNPHNFRHSRATWLAGRLTQPLLHKYLGLTPGSKMSEVYIHLSGEELDREYLQLYGITYEGRAESELHADRCPHCDTLNVSGALACTGCGMPLQSLKKEVKIW